MIEIKINQFKGPLNLLLDLIKNQKLDITQISLAKVTDQYLAYLENLSKIKAHEIADFLLVAAKLLVIKSKILLPQEDDKKEDDESDLINQLRIYRTYLGAGKEINKIINKHNFLFARKTFLKKEIVFSPPKMTNKKKLEDVFSNFLLKINNNIILKEEKKIFKKISIQERIKEIIKLLKTQNSFFLNSFFNHLTEKEEKVVTFLSVLELTKRREIQVSQENLFTDIIISRI